MAAARPYSQRFLYWRGSGVSQTWECPEGFRAVINSIAVIEFGTADTSWLLMVHGKPAAYHHAPGSDATLTFDGRWVLYERETCEFISVAGDIAWHVAGFLLTDDEGLSWPPQPVEPILVVKPS